MGIFRLSKLLPLLAYPRSQPVLLWPPTGAAGRRRSGLAGQQWFSPLLWISAMPLTAGSWVWGLEEASAAPHPPVVVPRRGCVVVLGGACRPSCRPACREVTGAGDRLLTGVRLMRPRERRCVCSAGGKVSFSGRDDPAPCPEAVTARHLALELGCSHSPHRPSATTARSDRRRRPPRWNRSARERGWSSVAAVSPARCTCPRALASFQRRTGLT